MSEKSNYTVNDGWKIFGAPEKEGAISGVHPVAAKNSESLSITASTSSQASEIDGLVERAELSELQRYVNEVSPPLEHISTKLLEDIVAAQSKNDLVAKGLLVQLREKFVPDTIPTNSSDISNAARDLMLILSQDEEDGDEDEAESGAGDWASVLLRVRRREEDKGKIEMVRQRIQKLGDSKKLPIVEEVQSGVRRALRKEGVSPANDNGEEAAA